MEGVIAQTTVPHRFRTVLLALLGSLAFVLAALGVYGVVSYSLSQRSREVAVHIALGAPTRGVLGMLLRQELRPVLIGVALGLAAALAMGRLLAGLLFGVGPADAGVLVTVPLLLIGVSLAATVLPARRAVRTDPAVLLRADR
jgi:putative ABC transport system permease protein